MAPRKSLFKLVWDLHKWTGLTVAIFLVLTSGTGLLLLLKKRVSWIQPPTQQGSPGVLAEFITIQRLVEVVLDQGHDGFRSLDDIDRIDFRPGKRVHKVRSRHGHAELQIDAVSGEVLSTSWRPSDLIEDLHDGSFFASAVHDHAMPLSACGLLFLSASGVYIWIVPALRKRRRR